MKKRLTLVSLFLFSFILMFTYACAQEARPITTPEPKNQQVEYALPYPGILPDHPLYFLKNVRDWLLKIFISQPVRKTEFEMLLSDKSLNMAIFLADQGKKDLALKTLRISVDHLKTTESYLFEIEETAKMFKDFFEDSYVTFSKRENSIRASIVTTNLAKRFKKMLDKNKLVILMSGTLHSDEVLKNICEDIAQAAGVKFYYEDFRTGFKAAHDKAKTKGMYRQNYCGCLFSKKERIKKERPEAQSQPVLISGKRQAE